MRNFDNFSFFLQMHRALLSEVVPDLRAVTYDIDFVKREFEIQFIFDTEIDNRLWEITNTIYGEMDISFAFQRYSADPITVKLPQLVPLKAHTAYCRYETILPPISKTLFPLEMQIKYPEAYLMTMLNQALLGRVTPNLRVVSLELDEPIKSLSIRFVYDKEVGSLEKTLAIAAFQETISFYPNHITEFSIIRVDYPKKWPNHGKRYAYEREEDYTKRFPCTPDDIEIIGEYSTRL